MCDSGTLRLKIDGNPGEIDLRALEKSVAAISKLIRAVGGENAQLKTLSADSIVVIDIITEPENASTLQAGLYEFAETGERPEKFNAHALNALASLYEVNALPGVSGVYFGSPANPLMIKDKVPEHTEKALGSVKGSLYRINGGRSLTAAIRHSQTGKTVRLELEKDQVETVQKLYNQKVIVRGLLIRDSTSNEVKKVKVKSIDRIAKKNPQQPASEAQGILGTEWLEGLDPVELVRLHRDSEVEL